MTTKSSWFVVFLYRDKTGLFWIETIFSVTSYHKFGRFLRAWPSNKMSATGIGKQTNHEVFAQGAAQKTMFWCFDGHQFEYQENIKHKVATKDKEQRYYEKNGHRHQHHAENYREKDELLWSHMQDARWKTVKTSRLRNYGRQKNKRGRPKRKWTDDLADWCNKDICTLYRLAMDMKKWIHLVKYVVDTNGHWAHGAREREREFQTVRHTYAVFVNVQQCRNANDRI